MSIIDLKEIAHNQWRAKYDGNYGIYTIKIEFDGQKRGNFSCSCPSDYYPCKHIAMVEKAIVKQLSKNNKTPDKKEISIRYLLKSVSHKELLDFVVKQAEYSPELANNIALEFIQKTKETNNYPLIIRKILQNTDFDNDSGYYEEILEIEELDKWLDKIKKLIDKNELDEALLICKAIIEEYGNWCIEQDADFLEYVDEYYICTPFEYLFDIIAKSNESKIQELLYYCKEQMSDSKYKKANMDNEFEDLFLKLCVRLGRDEFIAYQQQKLSTIADKSSFEAKLVLDKLISYYNSIGNKTEVLNIIKSNIQIEEFREQWVEHLIKENHLTEAKKLIQEFICKEANRNRYLKQWFESLLQIAQQEGDTPAIRKLSYRFIEEHFETASYRLYKSTFTKEEWQKEVEKLIKHYTKIDRIRGFNYNIADLYVEEKRIEQLIDYLENHLLIGYLVKYYKHFVNTHPQKTISFFKNTLFHYAKVNIGREHYTYIVQNFKLMSKINGGNAAIDEIIAIFRTEYKNRRAMMEIINDYK